MLGRCQDPRVGRGLESPTPTAMLSGAGDSLLCSRSATSPLPSHTPTSPSRKDTWILVSPALAQRRKLRHREVIQ